MSEQSNEPVPDKLPPGFYSLNALNVIVDGPGDTTIRPATPEKIAAMKRYWARLGRPPPPPLDKL